MRFQMLGSRHIRGFTLVELLIGMVISSLIIGATYAAYLAAHDSWDRCRVYQEQHQIARAALSFLERHLRAALPPQSGVNIVFEGGRELLGEEALAAEPEAESAASMRASDTLRFASVGGRISSWPRMRSDLCELEFYLEQPSAGEEEDETGVTEETVGEAPETAEIALSSLMVRRRNLPSSGLIFGVEEAEVEELASNVAGFQVAFFDGAEWVESWFSRQSLPRAVEITLVQADPQDTQRTVSFSRLIVLNMYRE